jgi:hypothetical protein
MARVNELPSIVGELQAAIPADSGVDIAELARQDIARQRGEIAPPTPEEIEAQFMATVRGETDTRRIGDFVITGNREFDQANFNALSPEARMSLRNNFISERSVPLQEEGRPILPFSGPQYKKIRLSPELMKLPEDQRNVITDIIQNRQRVASLFVENQYQIPEVAQDIILDSFVTGDFFDELGKAFEAIPGDFARMPTLAAMAYNAGAATKDGWFRGDEEDGMDVSFGEAFSESFNQRMAGWGDATQWYENWLNKVDFLDSATTDLNRWYKSKFYAQYADKEIADAAWKAAHQQVATRIVRPGDEDYSEDEARFQGIEPGLPYTTELDRDGNVMYEDRPLPVQLVAELVDLSYNELAASEKFAIFAGTQVPLTLGLTGASVVKGTMAAQKVARARTVNPGLYKDKNDWEVWNALKGTEKLNTAKALGTTFRTLTLSVFQTNKGSLNLGRNINAHLETLSGYDDRIRRLDEFLRRPNDYLDEIASYSPETRRLVGTINNKASSAEEVRTARYSLKDIFERDKKSAKKQYAAYTRKAGSSTGALSYLNNPYSRSLVADDILISGAIAYGPEFIPYEWTGMERDTFETFSMLTAPLFAPGLTRGSIALGTKIPVGGAIVKDMANLFANVPLVGFFARNIAEGADEAQMRRLLVDELGVEPTKDTIRAFNSFKQIYTNLKPEYRERVDRAFENYNETMTGIEDSLRGSINPLNERVFTDEEIQDIMGDLHLSLAQATGLSPLIAMQSAVGSNLTPKSMMKSREMDNVLSAMEAEEQSYRSLGTISMALTQKLRGKTGIDPEANVQLQQFLEQTAALINRGEEGLVLKRQELLRNLRKFTQSSTYEIDEDTIDNIVEMKTLLTEPEIRATINKADLVQETAVEIMEGARQQARALAGVSEGMKENEVLQAARSIADRLFDAEMGTKYALGKLEYRAVDRYVSDNNILVDLRTVAQKMMSVTEGFENRPFEYLFSGGQEFFSGVGSKAQRAFENSAKRGLIEVYGDTAYEMLQDTGSRNFTELAFNISSGDEAATFFKATVSETEDIYRAFKRFEISKKGAAASNAIDKKFSRIVDEAYADTDENLLKMTKAARKKWQKVVGYQTDPNTLGGDAQNALIRRNVEDMRPGEGLHRYRSVSKSPAAPFIRIANDVVKYINETDIAKQDEILTRILDQKDRIMYFAGGMTFPNSAKGGEYGFNIANAQRRRNADTVSTLLETLVAKKISSSYESQIQAIISTQQQMTGKPFTREEAIKRLSSGQDYDFGRAMRLDRIERELVVPVQNGDDVNSLQYRKLLKSDDIGGWTRNIDELLEKDVNARKAYTEIKQEIEDAGSEIRIAAQGEVDAAKRVLGTMEEYKGLVSNPGRFFDVVFENATPESIERVVRNYTDMGMSEEEVRASLAYMYQRGFFEKMGRTTEFPTGQEGPIQVMKEPMMLVDYVYTDRKGEVMRTVLGDDHYNDMKLFADYARASLGDAAGFRSSPDIRAMSLDSLFSRVFNIARGLVSIPYVATEVTGRMALMRQQKMLQLAMSDKQAASILSKMVKNPDDIERKDLDLLGLRLKIYLARGIVESGGEIPALDTMFGEETTKRQELLVEEAQTRERELSREEQAELLNMQKKLRELSMTPESRRSEADRARIRELADKIRNF